MCAIDVSTPMSKQMRTMAVGVFGVGEPKPVLHLKHNTWHNSCCYRTCKAPHRTHRNGNPIVKRYSNRDIENAKNGTDIIINSRMFKKTVLHHDRTRTSTDSESENKYPFATREEAERYLT